MFTENWRDPESSRNECSLNLLRLRVSFNLVLNEFL
jgi:hypothetical protein